MIRFLGLFDTVAAFGIPLNLGMGLQKVNLGWNVDTLPANVRCCAHAMALDERREAFAVSRQTPLDSGSTSLAECWFRGVHSDIGGTGGNSLGTPGLLWMLDQAERAGVGFDHASLHAAHALPKWPLPSISANTDPQDDGPRQPRDGDAFDEFAIAQPLAVGDTRTVRCYARVRLNPSGVMLEPGAVYDFTCDPLDTWIDGGIECNADGWDTSTLDSGLQEFIVGLGEHLRVLPQENWFTLCGVIGADNRAVNRFPIGVSKSGFVASTGGELYTFANDAANLLLKDFYDNNRGFVDLVIRRVA